MSDEDHTLGNALRYMLMRKYVILEITYPVMVNVGVNIFSSFSFSFWLFPSLCRREPVKYCTCIVHEWFWAMVPLYTVHYIYMDATKA